MTDDWWAFAALRQSFDDTQELLTPFDLGQWARLTVVTLLVGGGGGSLASNVPSLIKDLGSMGSGSTGTSSSAITSYMAADGFSGLSSISPGIIALALVVIAVVVGFMVLSSIAEFVFITMVRDEEFGLIDLFRRYAWRGVAYLGFGLGVFLIVLGLIGMPAIALHALGVLTGVGLVVLIPWALLVLLLSGFVNTFVRDVVLVSAMEEDQGLVATFRDLVPVLRENIGDTIVYWIMRFVINIAGGILSLLLILAVLIPLVIIGAIIGAVIMAIGVPSQVAVLLLVPALLVLFVAVVAVNVPIAVYTRYYGINVYRAIEGEL